MLSPCPRVNALCAPMTGTVVMFFCWPLGLLGDPNMQNARREPFLPLLVCGVGPTGLHPSDCFQLLPSPVRGDWARWLGCMRPIAPSAVARPLCSGCRCTAPLLALPLHGPPVVLGRVPEAVRLVWVTSEPREAS